MELFWKGCGYAGLRIANQSLLFYLAGRVLEWSIVREIQHMMNLEWELKFLPIYREANRCADELATMGCSLQESLIFFEQCPSFVDPLLLNDSLGMSIHRRISC